MPMVEAMLLEFAREATTTRRLLERVPHDQLAWKPHATSMALGQLARRVAAAPGQKGLSTGQSSGCEAPPSTLQRSDRSRSSIDDGRDRSTGVQMSKPISETAPQRVGMFAQEEPSGVCCNVRKAADTATPLDDGRMWPLGLRVMSSPSAGRRGSWSR